MSESASTPKLHYSAYDDWLHREGIPVIDAVAVNLFEAEIQPWPRMGGRGAYIHLLGRGDFQDGWVCEIPPGGALDPQRHVYDVVIYVLSGTGSTRVRLPNGREHSFEWGEHSLFAIPMNCAYRIFNGRGTAPALIAGITNLPLVLNFFHSERFVFDNPFSFEDRVGPEGYFRGDGLFIPVRPGRHMWETNFVPDLRSFELRAWEARGPGASNMQFVLADSTMHAHVSEMPVGTYKKAHRHGPEYYIFPVNGQGYSLLWAEGQERVRVDWRPGWVYAPPDMWFHQHFNISPHPSRYLALGFGGLRYAVTQAKVEAYRKADRSTADGGNQIDYDNEDPAILQEYVQELARAGIELRMTGGASHEP